MVKKNEYRVLVGIISILLLGIGIYIGFSTTSNGGKNNTPFTIVKGSDKDDKSEEDEENVKDEAKEENLSTVSTKTYDIEVVYRDNYTLCNHTIEEKEVEYGVTLDDLKKAEIEKQKLANKEYNILEESNERIVFTRNVTQNCPNHFLVKLENGSVVIYNRVKDGVNTVYKKMDISQETIMPELLEELNLGIKVDSKEELNFIIEDIES